MARAERDLSPLHFADILGALGHGPIGHSVWNSTFGLFAGGKLSCAIRWSAIGWSIAGRCGCSLWLFITFAVGRHGRRPALFRAQRPTGGPATRRLEASRLSGNGCGQVVAAILDLSPSDRARRDLQPNCCDGPTTRVC